VKGLRWREDTGYEGQCDRCRQYWPLDDSSWIKKTGFRRCRACLIEERAAYQRELRAGDPEMRARHRETNEVNRKAKRAADPASFREYQRRWYAANCVRLMAQTAERHLIRAELAGRPCISRRGPETPETQAYRDDFRRRWIAEHGPIVRTPEQVTIEQKREERRAYNREWMRRRRAA
jgi:hypothetical protein